MEEDQPQVPQKNIPDNFQFQETQQSVPMIQSGDETVKWLETTDDIIGIIELTLLNKVIKRNPDGSEELVNNPYGSPFMNEIGVNKLISIIKAHLHRGVTLSSFSDDEITRIMNILHIKLAFLILKNKDEFKIDKKDMGIIMEMITNPIYATIKRAAYEGERMMLMSTHKINEIRTSGDEPRRKFMGIF